MARLKSVRWLAGLSAAFCLAIAACNDGGGPTAPQAPVASIDIAPDSIVVAIGGSIQLTAVVRDASGGELIDRQVTWVSGNTSVAIVDSVGRVLGRAEGVLGVSAAAGTVVATTGVRVVLLDPDDYEVVVGAGDAQNGLVGTVLEEPLVASVRRREDGAPRVGIRVDWLVTEGAAELTRQSSVTGADGLAMTRLKLGEQAGRVEVEAWTNGLPPTTFSSTALPLPTVESVLPTSASPGDTIEVTVTDLASSANAEVLFNGVVGGIVEEVRGDPLLLSIVVPAPAGLCGPTVDVDVRLRVRGVTTDPVTIAVSVPAEPFQVGQVLVVEGTQEAQCAVMPADGGSAKYMLAVLSAEFQTVGQFQVTLSADRVAVSPVAGPAAAPVTDFHTRLRQYEGGLSSRGVRRASAPVEVQTFADPKVGSEREFWVLNNTELSIPLTDNDFDLVRASLVFKGVHTLVYLDKRQGLSQEDVEFLGRLYDEHLYGVAVDYFGEPTDIDHNDRVIVVLTPTVNSLSDQGTEAIIVGYTFGVDLFTPSLPGCSDCAFSNGGEIFYGIVADPTGIHTDPISRERALELLPAVMVHETQHVISLRYRLFDSAAGTEVLWLNEALAHAAEELGGDALFAAGEIELAQDMWTSDLDRAWRYLQDPSAHSMTAVVGGTLGERGASWLFLRWVAEQYGDFIFRELTQAPDVGVANVEARTGEPFFRLFADWAMTLWSDDLLIPGLAERYQIPKWPLRFLLTVDEPPRYALQPSQRTFAELRAGQLQAFLAAASPLFIEVSADGDTEALELALEATADAGIVILRIE